MAVTTRASKPTSVGTEILDQLAKVDARSLSPATARELLDVNFLPAARARIEVLMARSGEGRLTDAEQEELDEYLRVADLVAVLHSKARQALKASAQVP